MRLEKVTVYGRFRHATAERLAENDTINTVREFIRLLRSRPLWGQEGAEALLLDRVTLDLPRGERIGVVAYPFPSARAVLDVLAGISRHHSGRLDRPFKSVCLDQIYALTFPFTSVRANLRRLAQFLRIPKHAFADFEREIAETPHLQSFLRLPMRRMDRRIYFDLAIYLVCQQDWDLILLSSSSPGFHEATGERWAAATRRWIGKGASLVQIDREVDTLIERSDLLLLLQDGALHAFGPARQVAHDHAEYLSTIRDALSSLSRDPYAESESLTDRAGLDGLDDEDDDDRQVDLFALKFDGADSASRAEGDQDRERFVEPASDGSAEDGQKPARDYVLHQKYGQIESQRLKAAKAGRLPDRDMIGDFLYYNRVSDAVRLVGEGSSAIEVECVELSRDAEWGIPAGARFRRLAGQLPRVRNDRETRFRFRLQFTKGDLYALPIIDVTHRRSVLVRMISDHVLHIASPAEREFVVTMAPSHLLNVFCGVSVVVVLLDKSTGAVDAMVRKNEVQMVFENLPEALYLDEERALGPYLEDDVVALQVGEQEALGPAQVSGLTAVEAQPGRGLRVLQDGQKGPTALDAVAGSQTLIEVDVRCFRPCDMMSLRFDFMQERTIAYRLNAAIEWSSEPFPGPGRSRFRVALPVDRLCDGRFEVSMAALTHEQLKGNAQVGPDSTMQVWISSDEDEPTFAADAPGPLDKVARSLYRGFFPVPAVWRISDPADRGGAE